MIFNIIYITFTIYFLICFPFFAFSRETQDTSTKTVSSLKTPDQLNITIRNIIVETENKKLKSYITEKLLKYRNQKVSKKLSDEIHETLLSLLKKKNILLPQIEGPLFSFHNNQLTIVYTIYHPYKYGFVLVGNKNFDRYRLLSKKDYQKHFNNSQLIRKLLSHIKKGYLKKGYSGVSINHEIKTDYNNFIKTVFISIKEGFKTKIENIRLFGSFSRSEKHYVRFIKSHSGSLFQKKIFYNQDLQNGVKNLINSLKNEGYLKATAHTRVTNSSEKKVVIDIILNEGPLTLITEMYFTGNKNFSEKYLSNLIKTKKNTGLNINHLEQDIQTLIAFYKDKGFIEVELNNIEEIINYNKKTNTVKLSFNITENEKIIVSGILVKGNSLTKKEFIVKSLPVKTGDILTQKKIDSAIKKLTDLGIFSDINILTEESDKKKEERILIIQVEERKPRTLRFAVGLNTQRTLTARGSAEFSHRNIKGTGRSFSSHLKLQSNIATYAQLSDSEPDYLEHQASVSYTEPFLFSSSFNGQINLSNSDEIFSYKKVDEGSTKNAHSNKNSSYKKTGYITDIVNSTKINFQLNRTINQFIKLTWTLLSWEGRIDFKKTKNCSDSNKIFHFSLTSCDSNILNIASSNISLNIDKRDNILSPSKGFLSQMSIEYSGPFYIINSSDEIQFIKMEVKHFDFRPLFERWIWFNNIQGGFITNMNSLEKGGFPVSRAFILGGVNSLRGFDGLIHGERVPDKNEFPIDNANALIFSRSSFYFLGKTEMRFSINDNFTGTVFYNGGLVLISGKNFTQPYRHSIGFGLTYKTPVGPISGYLAFKINPKKGELPVVPHLSFDAF